MNKVYLINYRHPNANAIGGVLAKTFVAMVLLTILALTGFSQGLKITGTVKDSRGESLPGVTVKVKGTNNGAVTETNGKYTISVTANTAVLVFSYVGFQTQEKPIGTAAVINVTLMEQSNLREVDVVDVGYGKAKRANLTGAVGSVNMVDFAKAPVSSFDQALAGRVSGVQVQSSDGQPGSVANITIRGAGSITQDNSPLFVVDGFPSESSFANSISPADIESIDVLKDASSTAIYGARGANGVILITTKKGKVGAPQLNYNVYYGLQKSPQKMALMDPYNFVTYIRELNSVYADSIYFKNGITANDYKNVSGLDLQNKVFRDGQNQNHDISLRGGTDKTQYAISGNFNNQNGIIINSGFRRYQGRIVLDQKVNEKLRVGVNANYSSQTVYGQPVSATNFYASSSVLYSVWGYRPTTAISGNDAAINLEDSFYDPNNDISNNQDYRVNPYINLQNQMTRVMTTNFTANGYADYSFTPKLSLRVSGGITNNTVETNIFNNSLTQSGSKYNASGPNGTVANAPVSTWVNDDILTYKTTINKSHNITILAGFSAQGNTNSYHSIYATQISNEALGLDALDLVLPINTTVTSYSSRWMLASFLSRVNYDYKSKYLFTANFRADGSSKFAPGNRWGYFPSVSAAWRFNAETFAKKLSFLSDGKLRAGYGASGNNRVTDFAYLSQLSLSNPQYWYSSGNNAAALGAIQTAAGNANLKWETNKQYNIGIDLGFFQQRITLTADVYNRVTDNLLLNASLPYAVGIESSTGYKNVGSLQNRGLEIAINTVNINNKNFTWSSNFNISFNKNEILRLAEGQSSLLSGSGTFFNTTYSSLFPYISTKGRSVGEMYGLLFDGVYQYGDFDLMPNGSYLLKPAIAANGSVRTAIRPGDIKYKDINGDGTITSADYTIIGRGLPIHTGGFTNNFRYKNFDLNVLLQWSYGNNIINANRYVFEGGIVTNLSLNQFASYNDRWTPTNPSNTLYRAGGMANANYSSRVIEDGSYIKLKTVSLGYNFNKALLKKINLQNLRFYASAQNLYTLTNYSGMDPEVSARQSNLTPGFDYGTYPHSFSIVLGINSTF